MKAALVHLIFHEAATVLTKVAQHLAEHPFQRVVSHLSARILSSLHGLITIVADIKSSAVEMAGILGCISVSRAEFRYIILGTENTRHNDLVERNAFDLEGVEIGPSYIL